MEFIGTKPHLFICILPMAAVALKWQELLLQGPYILCIAVGMLQIIAAQL